MLLKRQRESMTPPNRDEKRKKDERPEVPTTSQTPQKQTNIQEGLPQRQKDEGKERARVSAGADPAFPVGRGGGGQSD